MKNIHEIARDIAIKTNSSVLIIQEKDLWVLDNKLLYSPSDHRYHNDLTGKPIDNKYIQGENFHEIELILEKTPKFNLILPHNYGNYQIIQVKN